MDGLSLCFVCIIEKDGEAVYSKLNVDKFIVSAKNMYDSRKNC